MKLQIVSVEQRKEGLSGVYTLFQIIGFDSLGPIEIGRRFKEFLYLRQMMVTRYPGLVIPPIPPKVFKNQT